LEDVHDGEKKTTSTNLNDNTSKWYVAIIPILSYFHAIARDPSTPICVKVLATA
jgi:hypothetical protein